MQTKTWAAGLAVLLVGACSSGDTDEPEQPEGSAVVGTVTPGERLTVVGDTDPV